MSRLETVHARKFTGAGQGRYGALKALGPAVTICGDAPTIFDVPVRDFRQMLADDKWKDAACVRCAAILGN